MLGNTITLKFHPEVQEASESQHIETAFHQNDVAPL